MLFRSQQQELACRREQERQQWQPELRCQARDSPEAATHRRRLCQPTSSWWVWRRSQQRRRVMPWRASESEINNSERRSERDRERTRSRRRAGAKAAPERTGALTMYWRRRHWGTHTPIGVRLAVFSTRRASGSSRGRERSRRWRSSSLHTQQRYHSSQQQQQHAYGPTQHHPTNPLARSLALSTPLHGTDRVDSLACSLLHAPAHLLLLSTSSSPAPLAPLHTPAEEASLAIWLCACVLLVAFGSLSLSLSSRAPKGCVRCSVTRRRDVRHVRSLAFDRRRRRRRRSHPKHLPLLPRPCVRE